MASLDAFAALPSRLATVMVKKADYTRKSVNLAGAPFVY